MTAHPLILAGGAFGHAVARRLQPLLQAAVLPVDEGTHPSLWPRTDLIVLATGSERPRLAEGVDHAAHAWKVPWFPVHLSPAEVQCGPVVVPGRTACHACYVKRRAQHGRKQAEERAPSGYPEHHVGIAAALARQAVEEIREGPASLGATVRRFGQVDGLTSASPVVAVDRCPRCRTRGEEETWERFAIR